MPIDCLPNKLQELKQLLVHFEKSPDIISLTEIKHKNKWEMNSAELTIIIIIYQFIIIIIIIIIITQEKINVAFSPQWTSRTRYNVKKLT